MCWLIASALHTDKPKYSEAGSHSRLAGNRPAYQYEYDTISLDVAAFSSRPFTGRGNGSNNSRYRAHPSLSLAISNEAKSAARTLAVHVHVMSCQCHERMT